MKHALIAASLVLVAGGAVGCGDTSKDSSKDASSEPAADASTTDFCDNFEAVGKELGALGKDAKDAEVVKALKSAGEKIESTGTPKDISADARKGFELTVKLISEIPDDATKEDIGTIDKDLSKDELAQEKAFNEYVTKTCAPS